ncbi:MAG: hypothetical protein A3G60_03415 [Candidatus Ryanbacteria bacterium RIFCSPLOWO2_12_FULL_47_9c]|uniref:Xaa-Pro dipeptidase n=2 Tax=Candidatus Ryaniibacteriota TaxID=1817914 RepID=A0A1G2H6I6_9BACT|nr:MAG: Xaa-Pro dipeptidase [Parcubacteria group bacterium GW2011_GWA1_47_9]OGZ47907.1 MAG: hypothetical protein A3C83_03220 [Candidatus Ryanbacteria bacterium RIFCSPHIGHO2_02_FULL_47_25]OGZ56383.1 MAG: hypothetical protein A3J04_03690 [Candidatus Ryanbacteria bacterium RIFCSPLOWO2_02_FULL_47_14]OGZ58074.1 MAG: hypothetical protein A3G60_03415 [Candidatus Ryanbacteria bacterium RIFCSPLOWO2_12_FULL_47_9c]
MIQSRLARVRRLMHTERADAFFVFNNEESGQPGTRYLSGFSGSASVLAVTRRICFLMTDGRYFEQVALEAPGVILVRLGEQPVGEWISNLAKKEHWKRVLVDGIVTSAADFALLKKRLRGVNISVAPGFLQQIRTVKETDEVKNIGRAAKIAAGAFHKFLKTIKIGETEKLLAARLDFFMKECGAERIAFDTIVASGANGARPHAQPTDKKIKKGEFITFDFGAVYHGYACDITRTAALGRISPALRSLYEAVRAAQRAGCLAARAGITGAALDEVCRAVLREHGYEDYFLHSTGHGLGMEVHELPIVSRANSKKLPAGSVITCEPGVYVAGLGGVRIEDDLALTKTGAKNLTRMITTDLITI